MGRVQRRLPLYREIDVAAALDFVRGEPVEAFVAVLCVVPAREFAHP